MLIFIYQTLDSIDGKHARRTKNNSPLGELFDHACDSVGTIFVILIVARTMGISDPTVLFYITQSGMLVFLMEHFHALQTRKVTFSRYTGPGELLLGCIAILLLHSFTGNIFSFTQTHIFSQFTRVVYILTFMETSRKLVSSLFQQKHFGTCKNFCFELT